MEFTFETIYDQKALKTLAGVLRKTIRKKRSRRSLIFGILSVALGVVLLITAAEINFRLIITAAAVAMIVLALWFQDDLNGYIARKRSLPGLYSARTTFYEDHYHSETELGSSDFPYENILLIAEEKDYLIFVFSANHGQIYDKASLTGASLAEFIGFIQARVNAEYVKL